MPPSPSVSCFSFTLSLFCNHSKLQTCEQVRHRCCLDFRRRRPAERGSSLGELLADAQRRELFRRFGDIGRRELLLVVAGRRGPPAEAQAVHRRCVFVSFSADCVRTEEDETKRKKEKAQKKKKLVSFRRKKTNALKTSSTVFLIFPHFFFSSLCFFIFVFSFLLSSLHPSFVPSFCSNAPREPRGRVPSLNTQLVRGIFERRGKKEFLFLLKILLTAKTNFFIDSAEFLFFIRKHAGRPAGSFEALGRHRRRHDDSDNVGGGRSFRWRRSRSGNGGSGAASRRSPCSSSFFFCRRCCRRHHRRCCRCRQQSIFVLVSRRWLQGERRACVEVCRGEEKLICLIVSVLTSSGTSSRC